ncbi:hypothetical protein MKZ38_005063 [Zalerion maritima]|uniref:Phenol 2-monooxygenase n=1 Tax=Zalerion maritima TaxID=339359 RepID=A0AAD5WR71_9PEZI|nr:hypothetical protein MKZ38_005063 [Zalerion maritima]
MTTAEVDVLIVGAGPAGLMLSLWLSRLGVTTRIVDKRTGKVFSGQADGFQLRTLEMLDSFGIGERIWKEANHMIEVVFWNPDPKGVIRRSSRVPDVIPGLSRFSQVVLHQGRMEQFFLDAIRKSYYGSDPSEGTPEGKSDPFAASKHIKIERCVIPTKLEVDESLSGNHDAHAVTVTLRHLTEAEATPTQKLSNLSDGLFRSNLAEDDVEDILKTSGSRMDKTGDASEEVVKARYVVGCDGAHSWTRTALGPDFAMVGEMTDFIWGVLDIVPITDFPDIRNRCMVHSESSGSMMVIPRENKLVRLYIQLTEVNAEGKSKRVDRSKITPDTILKAAQKILSPYKLEYHYCDWWTAYQIGQRVGRHFSKDNRVFLTGDAVHTHSPKAGQGMNVSMQDTFNLGWKLGLVCKGILRPELLSTYELERKQIAEELIAFDHKFSRLFSGRPAKDILDETGVSMEEFTKAFTLSHMFTTGVGINYQPSLLVAKEGEDSKVAAKKATSQPKLAKSCQPGTRFPSAKVLSQADGRPWELHHKMSSDGRFRMVVFGGDISSSNHLSNTNAMGEFLRTKLLPKYGSVKLSPGSDPHTCASKFKTAKDPSIIDVLLVHAAPRDKIEMLTDLDEVYHRFDEKLGWDYDRVFVDDISYHEGHGRAYEAYGVDICKGAVVLVRPDGYVGLVTELSEDGQKEVEKWFDGVLRPVA